MSGNDTSALLAAVANFIRRFIVLVSEAQATTLALWVLHTHAIGAASTTPYLAVLSPEKRSGKSRLLELLAALAARAEHVANVSEAALFRLIDHRRPTLMVDEVDALFGSNGERTEALRGVLNAGNRRGAVVYRCEGPRSEVRAFETFGAKVLAGIDTGRLPDTIADRSIRIRLERKRPGDRVERLIWQDVEADAVELRAWLEDWGGRFEERLSVARPDLPGQLDDRAAEGWWPLLAIADLAGADWSARARRAAVELSAGEDCEDDSRGVRLLSDIGMVFEGQMAMHTGDLLEALNGLEESAWGAWHEGAGMRPRDLGRLLRPYRIRSRSVRVGDRAAKGYHRDQLEEAWSRYVPNSGSQRSPGSQPAPRHEPDVTDVSDVTPDDQEGDEVADAELEARTEGLRERRDQPLHQEDEHDRRRGGKRGKAADDELHDLAARRELKLGTRRVTAGRVHWEAHDEHGRLAFSGRRGELEQWLAANGGGPS